MAKVARFHRRQILLISMSFDRENNYSVGHLGVARFGLHCHSPVDSTTTAATLIGLRNQLRDTDPEICERIYSFERDLYDRYRLKGKRVRDCAVEVTAVLLRKGDEEYIVSVVMHESNRPYAFCRAISNRNEHGYPTEGEICARDFAAGYLLFEENPFDSSRDHYEFQFFTKKEHAREYFVHLGDVPDADLRRAEVFDGDHHLRASLQDMIIRTQVLEFTNKFLTWRVNALERVRAA